jgi:hypothetical protein
VEWFLGHVCSLSFVNPCVVLSYVVIETWPYRVLSSWMQQAVGTIPPRYSRKKNYLWLY